MPQGRSRSYWTSARPSMVVRKFDRMIIVGLVLIGGAVTFSNDSQSETAHIKDQPTTSPLRSTTAAADIASTAGRVVPGGHVRIAMQTLVPNALAASAFDDFGYKLEFEASDLRSRN